MNVIEVKDVGKRFSLFATPGKYFLHTLSGGRIAAPKEFWALQEISFTVPLGETVGIIGQNGSGKSTLLSILAGVLKQTKGTYFIKGKIAALLELGAGFHTEFTGRENIYMYGNIMGIPTHEINRRLTSIIDFSELHAFIDQPLRTYSSGMIVRLAFSVAVHVDADILIVDEALAVGDALFQYRCFQKIKAMQKEGKTILYVGHDVSVVRSLCDGALLLDSGKIIKRGNAKEVVDYYQALIRERERLYRETHAQQQNRDHQIVPADELTIYEPNHTETNGIRFGPKDLEILHADILDEKFHSKKVFESGELTRLRVQVRCNKDIQEGLNIGFIIRNKYADVYGMNTFWLNKNLGHHSKGEIILIDFIQELNLGEGLYYVIVAPAVTLSEYDSTIFDWVNDAITFEVVSRQKFMGVINLHSTIELLSNQEINVGLTIPSEYRTNEIVSSFFKLYFENEARTWKNTVWQGIHCQKCPLDLWIYQEIVWELRPDIIIECGTADGGSTLFLASLCDLIGHGRVISIDITKNINRPTHPRITYLTGSSTVSTTISHVQSIISPTDSVLVILDSDHTADHVLQELRLYSKFVKPEGYMIVEDTCVNGNPILPDHGPGPLEALDQFLKENSDFVSDTTREKFYLTFNPRGYLRRI